MHCEMFFYLSSYVIKTGELDVFGFWEPIHFWAKGFQRLVLSTQPLATHKSKTNKNHLEQHFL